MHRNTKRLDQRAVPQRDMRRQLVAAFSRDAVVHAQRAVDGRGRGEDHVVAQVVSSSAAGWACVTGDAGFEGDAVADCEALSFCLGTEGSDYAGGFVAEEEGVCDDVAAELAVVPVVDLHVINMGSSFLPIFAKFWKTYIRTTETGCNDPNDHIAV
jgi:hypothetical protein